LVFLSVEGDGDREGNSRKVSDHPAKILGKHVCVGGEAQARRNIFVGNEGAFSVHSLFALHQLSR